MYWIKDKDTYIKQVMSDKHGSDVYLAMNGNGKVFKGSNRRDISLSDIQIPGQGTVYDIELDRTETEPIVQQRIAQIDALVTDIDENGISDPIWVTDDNIFVTGFLRLYACKLLGKTTVPCVTLDDADEHWFAKSRRHSADNWTLR
jgi:hypothetical protein